MFRMAVDATAAFTNRSNRCGVLSNRAVRIPRSRTSMATDADDQRYGAKGGDRQPEP